MRSSLLEKQNEIAAHIHTILDQAKQLRAEAAAGLEQARQEVEAMMLGQSSCRNRRAVERV